MTCWRPVTTCCKPGDIDDAGQVTEAGLPAAAHLGGLGSGSLADPRHPHPAARGLSPPGRYIHQLGILAHDRGDYDEAARQYQRSLDIKERLGDQAGMASSYHQLGILAQDRGDYDEAARQYQRSLDINERLGNQAGMAISYHQLGILAQDRGDYDEAARQYQRSLDINERLGDQAGMASSYHQLGILAQDRGDYDEAARQYQRSLDINERLGNQAGMATSYHQLGILAQAPRGLRRGRPPVPALPRHQRAARRPGRHGHQLPPARHPRPPPRGLRRGRPPVPARPSTSASGSATRPAWPPATTSSASSPRTAGTTTRPPASTSAALDINERLGDQAGMATSYHQLGILAQDRGDYDEAARQYQASLDINERLGDQAGMAVSLQPARHPGSWTAAAQSP